MNKQSIALNERIDLVDARRNETQTFAFYVSSQGKIGAVKIGFSKPQERHDLVIVNETYQFKNEEQAQAFYNHVSGIFRTIFLMEKHYSGDKQEELPRDIVRLMNRELWDYKNFSIENYL